MTDRVLGPGGRGVLVVLSDAGAAAEEVRRLEAAGIPATTPAVAGLRLTVALHLPDAVRFWSTAIRRTAVGGEGGDRWAAAPGGDAVRLDRDASLPLPRPERPAAARAAVFGGAWVGEAEPAYGEALLFGRLAAEHGLELANGGYGGIMAAVSRGAVEAGGTAVGVTIGSFSEQVPVNRWLTHEVEARDLFARLPLICDAEAWVAFPGGVGTLAEVALCWNLVQTGSIEPRPLVIVGERWDRALTGFREWLLAEGVHFDLVRPASSAEGAMEIVEHAATR